LWKNLLFWRKDNSQESWKLLFKEETKSYFAYDIYTLRPLPKYDRNMKHSVIYLQNIRIACNDSRETLEKNKVSLKAKNYIFYEKEKNRLLEEYQCLIDYLKNDLLRILDEDRQQCLTQEQHIENSNNQ
jgi:hypothetical protein